MKIMVDHDYIKNNKIAFLGTYGDVVFDEEKQKWIVLESSTDLIINSFEHLSDALKLVDGA